MKISSNQFLSFFILILTVTVGISCQNSGANSADENSTNATENEESTRIISLSGFLTELLFALDMGDQVVGVDVTSTYPEQVNGLPKLGHITQLNAEGILSLNPDIIFVQEEQARRTEALAQLENSAVEIVPIPVSHTLSNPVNVAKTIAQHVTIDPQSIQNLQAQVTRDSLALKEYLKDKTEKPSVLFIYARGGGNLMVAGNNTNAQAIIELAGGKNAITAFDQFRALTPEALVQASPDVILIFDSGLEAINGKEGLASVPGISQTAAFKNDRIIAMDGHYLTSFGPRTGQAALELAKEFFNPNPEM